MKIKRIAIVGGGSAGWLAANHLGLELHLDPEIEITLIESEDVPIIGVGEGTVPRITSTLEKFGIGEADFIAGTDATFKHGIKFVEWLNPTVHGSEHYYYHPFATAFPDGFDVTPYMLSKQDILRFSDVSTGIATCEAMRCPKRISSPPYQGEINYAYHFNAHKFAAILEKNAKEKYAVTHKFATILKANQHPDGSISSLLLNTGETLEFDFYIDCSGFSSVLAGGTLAVPFIDKSNQILTDTALVQQVLTGDEEIPPYTKATAHKAGWIWDIPVINRRGTGFVYSSAHMSEEAAMESFSKYLGVSNSEFSPRKISMNIGYRKDFWSKNCISLGLAQGFVEPLEATSIFLTDMSAELFAKNFPKFKSDIEILQGHCNEVVEYWWERTIDFIQLHYYISDRNDSKFWLDSVNSTHLSNTLKSRLSLWQLAPPKKSDFFSSFDLFDATSYSYILYGMKFNTRQPLFSNEQRNESIEQLEMIRQKSEFLAKNLPGHREWLSKLRIAMAQ